MSDSSDRDDPRLRQILDAAADLPGDQRPAFLDEACGGEAGLRAEVEALLATLGRASGFLASPTEGGRDETAPTPMAHESKPGRVGRYKLLERIGEGGMGAVYVAEQEHPVRRRVAVKVIKLGMDTRQVVARFEAERQALAMMDHPNIASVLDAGSTETGRPYFVMELVRGVCITDYCDQHHLTTRQRLELFVPVCRAVQHAHQKGIIHRDLKPSNVLVTLHDGVPVPKVIDFGVAKATGGRLTDKTVYTEFHQFVGTPEYMSPEQAEMSGLDIDTRADVYALGVLLYELLTGTTPFDGKELRRAAYAEIQRIIREVEPPKPSTRLSTLGETLTAVAARRSTDPKKLGAVVRGDLDWIVMKCLEKDRTRRYETANGVAADVQRYLNDEPVAASPPSATYRLRKYGRKYKKEAAGLGAIAALLILGIVGTSMGMIRARFAEQIAKQETLKAERQAEHATATNGFMMSMLESARPTANRNLGDIRMVDILEAAAGSVDRKLANQPDAESQVRGTLGRTFLTMGMWAQAQEQFKRAYEVACASRGEESEQALRAAVGLIYTIAQSRPGDAESLARKCHEIAKRRLGAEHTLTEDLEAQIATALASAQKFDEAEAAYRSLIERSKNRGRRLADNVGLYHGYATVLFENGKLEEAEGVERPIIELIQTVPDRLDVSLAGRCRLTYARILIARGKLAGARKFFESAVSHQREELGRTHPDTEQTLALYADLLEATGQYQEALETHRELLEIDRRLDREEDWSYLWRGGKIANLQLALGQRSEAVRTMNEAIARAAVRVDDFPDVWLDDWANTLLTQGLGPPDRWKSRNLHSNVWCAIREHFVERPGGGDDLAVETVDWDRVRFRMHRWDVAAGAASPVLISVAEGGLDDLKNLSEPGPGVYRLSLDVARPSVSEPQVREAWLVFTEWDVNLYTSGRKDQDPEVYRAMLTGKPAERRRLNNLAIPHSEPHAKPGPGGSTDYFALTASGSVDLPAGRYRFSITSDDGVRLYVDGLLVIDSWIVRHPDRDNAVLELGAGHHPLRVEFFQKEQASQVWLQLAPAPHVPITTLPVIGGDNRWKRRPPFNPAGVEAEFAAEIRRRPSAATPLFERARFLAKWGHFTEAARDFAAGLNLDDSDHRAWAQSAIVLLRNGDVEGYRRHCEEMLKRFGASTDRTICAGTVRVCALTPNVADSKTVMELADRAVAPGDFDELNRRGYCALAKGMAEYRAGHFEVAVEWLNKSIEIHANYGPVSREPFALYYIAMAEFRLGHATEADTAIARADALFEKWGPRGSAFGKFFTETIGLMLARREAAGLLGRPLGPPATGGS
jgi:serine/threonine protein kinase/tetratricopeptide (TPR) repeat protein